MSDVAVLRKYMFNEIEITEIVKLRIPKIL